MKSIATFRKKKTKFSRGLMYQRDNDLVVLCTHSADSLTGVIIAYSVEDEIGRDQSFYCNSVDFTPFQGTVVLES